MEEVVRDAWVPARGELMAGMAGKAPAGGAVGGRRETEEGAGGGIKRIQTQFPKIPGTSL